MAKQKQKVSAKQIEAELEKKATLNEKKEFLESTIKTAKGKAKEKLEKLLEGINNIIEEEKNLEERAKFLEQRLATTTEEAEKLEEEKRPEATYARPRERAPMQEPSSLEREVVADRPAIEEKVSFGGTEHKELFKRDITYLQSMSQGRVLSTLVHYLQREGLDPTRGMSSAQEQMVISRVTEYFGGSANIYQVRTYLASLKQTGLPADVSKYKASTT